MARVLHLWNEWEVQILVLLSFMLQVFLLIFARMRRRSISQLLRIVLWLMYLLADSIAIYTLGHMSISCKPDEHHKLMAFWAPFFLVHLGGQDTITAYSMEDNQLWLRHALTFLVQAVGTVYVLYKNIGRQWTLVVAAAMMFLAGVLKILERVWALSSSSLDSISNYLDNVEIRQKDAPYYARGEQLDSEVVLQGAHDLLYICMGQFVDDKVCPSKFQMDALKLFLETNGSIYELIEMQLSLLYDTFYTKAAVIHTWWGRCFRAVSLLSIATSFFMFHFSTVKVGYNRVDVVVTYTLLVGASLLEMASVLRAVGSTWTCALLKARGWNRLHKLLVSLRRSVRAAQTKRWSGSIGQHNLVDSFTDDTRLPGCSMVSFSENGSSMISAEIKGLVRAEIQKMVLACGSKENVMRSYRGQCTLQRYGLLEDLTWCMEMEFDDSILAWHLATHEFLKNSNDGCAESLVKATKAFSDYMMFLFVERPYMLPPPVRPRLYDKAREELKESLKESRNWLDISPQDRNGSAAPACTHGANLAMQLLNKKPDMPELLQVAFGVWVEMLCYAAHHCSRDSHARQLNSGGDFITIVWLLTTAEFNNLYYREGWFKERVHHRWRWSWPLSWRNRWRCLCYWLPWRFILLPCCFLLMSCLCCIFRKQIRERIRENWFLGHFCCAGDLEDDHHNRTDEWPVGVNRTGLPSPQQSPHPPPWTQYPWSQLPPGTPFQPWPQLRPGMTPHPHSFPSPFPPLAHGSPFSQEPPRPPGPQ